MSNSAARLLLAVILTSLAYAQSDRVTYQRDVNGRMVPVGEVRTTADGHVESTRIVDGRPMPQEQTDEKIVRQDASGKVVERTIKTFAPTGQLVSTERVVIEETNKPGGSTVKQTSFRTDINGHSQEFERRVTETKTQGQSTNVETTVQNPNPSGSFTTTQRVTKVTSGPADNQQTTESVYLAGRSGDLHETQRSVASTVVKGSQTTSNTANYDLNSTGNGAMLLREQTVSVNTRQPNGAEVVETNVYGPIPGKADAASGTPSLRESQRTERQVAQDGSVTERTTVRRAEPSSSGRLGAEQVLSEGVCKGKCLPEKEAAAKPKDATTKPVDSKSGDAKATARAADPNAAPSAAASAKR